MGREGAIICVLATAALAGCGGALTTECSFELSPDDLDARRPVEIPNETLRDHPAFADLVERAGRERGASQVINCGEGEEIMGELDSVGAQFRWFSDTARDTMVLVKGDSYKLLLAEIVT